jgi:hypothetical protein
MGPKTMLVIATILDNRVQYLKIHIIFGQKALYLNAHDELGPGDDQQMPASRVAQVHIFLVAAPVDPSQVVNQDHPRFVERREAWIVIFIHSHHTCSVFILDMQ